MTAFHLQKYSVDFSTMASYQHDTSKGEYEPINNGSSNGNGVQGSGDQGKKKRWLIAGVILVLLAVFFLHKPAGASTEDAIKKSSIPLNVDGSVKLFDKLSKYTSSGTVPREINK